MFIDYELMFFQDKVLTADAQADVEVWGKAGGGLAGNPAGEALAVHAQVTEAFTSSSGDPTVTLELHDSDDSGFSSSRKLAESDAYPRSQLVKGFVFPEFAVPPGAKRFLRLKALVGTGMSGGKISAWVGPASSLQAEATS